MIYLYIDKNQVKLLSAKKSLFGQYSVDSYEKKFQVDLLKNGTVVNVDILASAIKEILQNTPSVKDKHVYLILPQEAFHFLRTEVPNDIATPAIDSFVKDKLRTTFAQNTGALYYDYFFIENGPQKYISLFAIEASVATKFQETVKLLDLEVQAFLPETLAFFKLFEKTLRVGKVENILYGKYEKDYFFTYLFDSFGLLEEEKNEYKLGGAKKIEQILKARGEELEKKSRKINRLILSGPVSETIRQDTFTKEAGMWTNPLKKIILQFYDEYVKMLLPSDGKPLSLLEFDVCLGAFIFSVENKDFSPLRRTYATDTLSSEPFKARPQFKLPNLPSVGIPKEILLFVASFIVSFGLFSLVGKTNIRLSLPNFQKPPEQKIIPTVEPPSPTSTPAFTREELKIKILNGSGTRGKASVVKDVLKEKKYLEIVTGNADNFDYQITEIQVKKSKKEAANYILADLKDYTQQPSVSEDLGEEELPDVVIIVGQDFK
ncbi:MAG: LytR C-terminal domain-containing protein [Patescibacteria group bacterium]